MSILECGKGRHDPEQADKVPNEQTWSQMGRHGP